jgi:hypothetical protein
LTLVNGLIAGSGVEKHALIHQIPDVNPLSSSLSGCRYLGVDIVATQIEKHRVNLTRHPVGPGDPTWEFGVLDITKEPIPEGFDLLFSRDALQHLNMGLVLNALENIARTKAKYFLVGR